MFQLPLVFLETFGRTVEIRQTWKLQKKQKDLNNPQNGQLGNDKSKIRYAIPITSKEASKVSLQQ